VAAANLISEAARAAAASLLRPGARPYSRTSCQVEGLLSAGQVAGGVELIGQCSVVAGGCQPPVDGLLDREFVVSTPKVW